MYLKHGIFRVLTKGSTLLRRIFRLILIIDLTQKIVAMWKSELNDYFG